MGRTSDARERLIEAMVELIWTGSYGSTSVDSICERAGVKKGSFYHFFPSKTDLALAAIDHAFAEARAQLDGFYSPVIPPLERLRKHAEHEVEFQADLKRKYKHVLGCPAVSLGAEVGTMEESLRKKLCSVIACFQSYYESAIRDAQRMRLIPEGDPAVMARRISAYMEGTLTLARIHNDLSIIEELPDGILGILGAAQERRKAA